MEYINYVSHQLTDKLEEIQQSPDKLNALTPTKTVQKKVLSNSKRLKKGLPSVEKEKSTKKKSNVRNIKEKATVKEITGDLSTIGKLN